MHLFAKIYPPRLIVLAIFPQLVAILINSTVYDFREIAILFAWIPLLTIPSAFLRTNIAGYFPFVIVFADGLITIVHYLFTKGPLTAASMFVFTNTNTIEATEFIQTKFGNTALLLIPYFGIFIWSLRDKKTISDYGLNKWVLMCSITFSVVFISENYFSERLVRKGIPQNIEAFISFNEELAAFNKLKTRKIRNTDAESIGIGNRKQVTLLVIGESASKKHMSLYGYKRSTNPLLSKNQEIYVFNSVVSGYTITIPSVLSILTESNLENKLKFDKSTSLFDNFSSAGFETFWISNQSPIGVWDNAIYNLAQTANNIRYVNTFSNSSLETTLSSSFDENTLPQIVEALQDTNYRNKFIGVHLMGSHMAYDKRYPDEFQRFKNGKSKKDKTIDHYDNSIIYNDFIIDKIIALAKKQCAQDPDLMISLMYVSDHGEDVYDTGDHVGHDWAGSIPNCIVEVPLIVWLSQSYKKNFPEKTNILSERLNHAFTNTNVFHAIMDLSHIRGGGFDSTLSLFNKHFIEKKIMLENGQVYKSSNPN